MTVVCHIQCCVVPNVQLLLCSGVLIIMSYGGSGSRGEFSVHFSSGRGTGLIRAEECVKSV